MAVEFAFSQAREVFPASDNFGSFEPRQEFTRIRHGPARVTRHCAGAHHSARSVQRQIKHWSEVNVKSQSPAILADDLAMSSKKVGIIRREHVGSRWCRSKHIPKSIDAPALKINTRKQRCFEALPNLAQQMPGLLRTLGVPCKQDYTCRL